MNRFTAAAEDLVQRSLPYGARRAFWRAVRPGRYLQMQQLRADVDHEGAFPFDQHNCVFVHIPKTAGVSIATALFGRRFGGHRTLRDWQLAYSRRELGAMFTFAFVRDPWTRLASAWRFLKAGGRNAFDQRWAERHLSQYDDFDAFVRGWVDRTNIWKRQHFWPQYWYVQDQPRDIGVDFIGRFEQLPEDYETVRARLGVGEPLPHLNPADSGAADPRPATADYTPETAAIVAEVYRTDIELFSYESSRPC